MVFVFSGHWRMLLQGTPGSRKISAIESRIFWLSMLVSQILWVVFSFASLFRLNFKWLVSMG